jgi:hypothetical protein
MKIKTNIRAGQGGATSGLDSSTSTSSGVNSGGVNSGGVNGGGGGGGGGKVVYTRCAGY